MTIQKSKVNITNKQKPLEFNFNAFQNEEKTYRGSGRSRETRKTLHPPPKKTNLSI